MFYEGSAWSVLSVPCLMPGVDSNFACRTRLTRAAYAAGEGAGAGDLAGGETLGEVLAAAGDGSQNPLSCPRATSVTGVVSR